MPIITYQLFLGLLVDLPLEDALARLDPQIKSHYISEEGPYLRLVTEGKGCYLGKYAGSATDLSQLKLLEANILSILSQLLPGQKVSGERLQLISLKVAENDG